MKPFGGTAVLLLMPALLAGPAYAAPSAAGDFIASGSVTATGAIDSASQPLGVFIPDSQGAARLSGELGDARICVYEIRVTVVEAGIRLSTPQSREPPRCWRAGSAHVESTTNGDHTGWFGLEPQDGSTLARSGDAFASDSRAAYTLKSEEDVGHGGDDQPFFVLRLPGPLLYSEAPGTYTFTGGAALKLRGPDFSIVTAANRTRVDTGDTYTDTPTGRESVRRWAVVTFDAGTLTFTTPEAAQVAAKAAMLNVDGTLYLTPTDGALNATLREYPSTGRPESITGRLFATLTPGEAGESTVALRGELHATTLAPRPAPVLGNPEATPWGMAALVVGVVALGGAAVVVARRLRQGRHVVPVVVVTPGDSLPSLPLVGEALPNPPSPSEVFEAHGKELVERGWQAIGKGRHEDAAYLFRRATGLAPELGDAWMGLGYAHYYARNWWEAALAFLRAARYVTTGEPEAMAAECAVNLQNPEAAADYLRYALKRPAVSRAVVDTVGEHAELMGLIGRYPGLSEAWEEAKVRAIPKE